jgi:hypothetical protein
MSAPILKPGYNEGYPSPVLVNTPAIKFTVKTKYIDIRIGDTYFNEGYPNNNNYLVDVADMKVQKQPFPKILPSVIAGYNEDYPVINEVNVTNMKVQKQPFPKILPSVIAGYNEDYPVINEVNVTNMKVQTRPFPRILPSVIPGYNEDYPVINEVDMTYAKVKTRPFPRILPSVIPGYNENYPVINEVDMTNAKVQESPFPKILPDMDHEDKLEGYPSFEVLGYITDFGAFTRSGTIEVEIPYSVMYICDYAFYDTPIKSVKINRHCKYFEHSFPPGCHIKPYNDKD